MDLHLFVRAAAVWVVIAAAETVHGIARRLVLEPLVGDLQARRIAVFTGSALAFTAALIFVRWLKGSRPAQFLAAGLLWVVLTVCFELGLGTLMGLSSERMFSDYDLANGGLLPIGLFLMFLSPIAAAKLRNEV